MEKMQKLNLRMQKLNFPGTHWRGLALIGAQKKPCTGKRQFNSLAPLGQMIWIDKRAYLKCCSSKKKATYYEKSGSPSVSA